MNVLTPSKVKWSYGWVNKSLTNMVSMWHHQWQATNVQQDVSKLWNVQQVHCLHRMAFHSSCQKQLVLTP